MIAPSSIALTDGQDYTPRRLAVRPLGSHFLQKYIRPRIIGENTMEVARDLIRDLVGILFPGGLLVILTLLAIWAVIVPFNPSASFDVLAAGNRFIVLIIISYVAGQSLRMRRLEDLEKRCTEEYRKKNFPNTTLTEWKKRVGDVDRVEKDYFLGKSDIEKLKEAYRKYNDEFRFWEIFPYGYRLRARMLLHQSESYVKFYEKYDKQCLTKTEAFFNFCKSVIYEYSPSFKEEMLRQESLVRLFAGIYYVLKYGKVVAIVVSALHLALIAGYYFKPRFPYYPSVGLSYEIVLASILAFFVFIYMNKEIVERLRTMRVKELNLAYDAFYLICKKHNLDL